LIQQDEGVRVIDNTVFYDGISDNIVQLLCNDHRFTPKFPYRFVQIENVSSHQFAGNGFPCFFYNQGFSTVFSESHLLNKCIHDDERHNWKQLRIVLYIVNFKYDKRFVKKRIVGTFVECRSIPSPFIEIPQNK
jgi:hypothetical protein